MASLYQTELCRIGGQLRTLAIKLKGAKPSERQEALLTLERAVTDFVERIDALDRADPLPWNITT